MQNRRKLEALFAARSQSSRYAPHRLMQQVSRLQNDRLRLYFLSMLFVGFNTVLTGYFTAVEQAFPAQMLTLLRGFVLIVPLALLLSARLGITGIWLTYPITEAVTAAAGIFFYHRQRNMRPQPLQSRTFKR